MNRFRNIVSRFRADRRGATAIVFGLVVTLLVGTAGIAVDYGRALKTRAVLQAAADAAVLTAARNSMDPQAILSAIANDSFDANSTSITNPVSKTFDLTGDFVTYTASTTVSMTLSAVLVGSDLDISVMSKARRRTDGTEIVIALDATASMAFGSSWEDAKSAMADMLSDLDSLSKKEENFHATFFPFSDRVNVGLPRAKTWLSVAAPSNGKWGKTKNESGNTRHTNRGCLEPRSETVDGNPSALTDAAPATLGFLPTAENYYVSWLARKHYFTCPADEIMGPTTDIGSFQSAISNISLEGTGRFDVAMAWAYRLLSPNWKDYWDVPNYPADYGDRRKIVVFISDAYTEAYRYEVPNKTAKNPENAVFGHNKGSQKGFENFVATCEMMKANDIEVHTIYVNGNGFGVPYMKSCASSVEMHYHAVTDITEFRNALSKISTSIVSVSLTQ